MSKLKIKPATLERVLALYDRKIVLLASFYMKKYELYAKELIQELHQEKKVNLRDIEYIIEIAQVLNQDEEYFRTKNHEKFPEWLIDAVFGRSKEEWETFVLNSL